MEQIVTISSSFQLYIPKKIREMAGFTVPGKYLMKAKKGMIVIEKLRG